MELCQNSQVRSLFSDDWSNVRRSRDRRRSRHNSTPPVKRTASVSGVSDECLHYLLLDSQLIHPVHVFRHTQLPVRPLQRWIRARWLATRSVADWEVGETLEQAEHSRLSPLFHVLSRSSCNRDHSRVQSGISDRRRHQHLEVR